VAWLKHWPYAAPKLMSTCFVIVSAGAVVFGLENSPDAPVAGSMCLLTSGRH